MQETVKKVLNGDFNRKKALLFLITALLTVIVWNLPIDSFGIEGLTIVQQRVIAIFVMAVMLWLTEAIPAWATSVVIIFVLLFFVSDSAFKIMQGSEAEMGKLLDYQGVMACFADPTIILFLGGFVLAIAATKSGLDVMMAKALIAPFGKQLGINANTVAMLPIAIFALTGVVTAKDLKEIDWAVIWMVAGGFALGLAMNGTGLAEAAVKSIPFAEFNPLVIMIVSGLVCFILSNFISNTATAALLIPILTVVCAGMGDKLNTIGGTSTILIGVAVSASCAMSLPISTPS